MAAKKTSKKATAKKTGAKKSSKKAAKAVESTVEQAPPEKVPEPTKVENFQRDLKTALEREELATRAERCAQLVHLMHQEDEALKAYSKSVKSKIATLEAEHNELSSEVRLKYTFKTVDCERHFVYAEKLVKEIRTDTGEEIDVRGMKNHELQKDLFEDSDGLEDEFSKPPEEEPEEAPEAEEPDAPEDNEEDDSDEPGANPEFPDDFDEDDAPEDFDE